MGRDTELQRAAANSHPERSQSKCSKLPEACEPPVARPLTPPSRLPGREFQRLVFGSPLSPEARQKILTTYDFEKSYDEQPGSVISELDKVMGYEDWPFVNEHDRARIIRDKARSTLNRFLWSHGYHWLTSTTVDGKPRLVISPAKGVEPKPFPDWFTTPFVHRVPHQDFSYKPDTGGNVRKNSVVRPLTPPPRWPGRQFQRHVSRSPVSPEARQKILTTYDFETFEQPESVILELEKWMGYEGWPFIDDHDRADAVGDKAYDTLHRFLWDHGYHWLTSTTVDGKPRLVISPAKGVEPKPFPDWFTTPYVHRVPHQDFSYKPEARCENPTITGGHAILDSDH